MEPRRQSIFDKPFNPMYQGLLVIALYAFLLGFIMLLKMFKWVNFQPLDYWKYATSMILFYVMLCCVFCFSTKDKIIYYRNSIFTYLILLILFSLISQFQSGLSIFEAESYSWILTVFSIIFVVMLTIINLVRKIVEVAIKQDNKLKNEN